MAQTPPHLTEADQLRADIRMLRGVLDSATDRHADRNTVNAVSDLIRERRERLEEIEHALRGRQDGSFREDAART